MKQYIHTYIIGLYNPSVRVIDLVSHTTNLCALILYISGGTYSLKSTPNDKFFEKVFMAILFYSQSCGQKSAERKSPKKYFSYYVLILAWDSTAGFWSNKPTYYLLDHGDFAYPHNLYIAVELHTNFVLIHFGTFLCSFTTLYKLCGYAKLPNFYPMPD